MTLFGYDQGVFGGVIVTPDFLKTTGLGGAANTTLLGTVTAIYDVGCFFGAIAATWVGEKIGRKKSVLVGTTIMTVGAIIQISAYGTAQMIVGRVIAGIGNGINTATGKKDCHQSEAHTNVVTSSCLADRNQSNQMERQVGGH